MVFIQFSTVASCCCLFRHFMRAVGSFNPSCRGPCVQAELETELDGDIKTYESFVSGLRQLKASETTGKLTVGVVFLTSAALFRASSAPQVSLLVQLMVVTAAPELDATARPRPRTGYCKGYRCIGRRNSLRPAQGAVMPPVAVLFLSPLG